MKLSLPLFTYITKHKKFYFNLNTYRNAHYHEMNKAKRIMKDLVLAAVVDAGLRPNGVKLTGPLKLQYTLYPKTKRKVDVANVLSIVQKFVDDALIDLGFIDDDNFEVIREVTYRFGVIDPENPRAELVIEPFQGDADLERQRTLF